jgi:hypothetical protein
VCGLSLRLTMVVGAVGYLCSVGRSSGRVA